MAITIQEKEELAAGLAKRVVELGLAGPALLFLESHRPFYFLGSQLLIFASPFLGAEAQRYASLLEDPSGLQALLTQLHRGVASGSGDEE